MKNKEKIKRVLVFCAHSDDQIFGLGGTLAKYADENVEISVIIFSFGEKSHPIIKKNITAKIRVKESKKANKIVGVKETIFLGLREGKFDVESKEKNIVNTIIRFIKNKKPDRIFTHSQNDLHKDHRDVFHIVLESAYRCKFKGDIYAYDVWNFLNIKNRDKPKLFVDITKYFKKKIKALMCFKSQRLSLFVLIIPTFIRDLINGIRYGKIFGEIFYKVY